MSPKRKYKTVKGPTRQLLFDRPVGIQLEFLMDLYLKIIGDYDVELDMKLDKIKLVLAGDKIKNEKIARDLIKLQGQLMKATTPDISGRFHYDQEMFQRLFKSQVSTKLLKDGLMVLGFDSELDKNKTLISEIGIRQLVSAQKQIYETYLLVPQNENKDIQNFLTLLILRTQRSTDQIIETAGEEGVLGERDGRLYFAGDKDKGFEKLVEILMFSSPKSFSLDSLEEDESDDFGFDGGKMVFIKDGEKLEQSSYDPKYSEEMNQ